MELSWLEKSLWRRLMEEGVSDEELGMIVRLLFCLRGGEDE